MIPVVTTVSNVMLPPKTTAVTVPINFAVSPLSKAPSSLDDPTNMEFTEETLPRISSGVLSWRIVCLITIDTPSVTPLKNKATTEIQNIEETPKTIIQTPKPKIATNSFLPAALLIGIYAVTNMVKNEPIDGAVTKIPNPCDPTLNLCSANKAHKAIAPPHKTETIHHINATTIHLVLKNT